MGPRVLILDRQGAAYRDALLARFPNLTIAAAPSAADLGEEVAEIEVLVAFGLAVTDDVLRRATRLKWIQSLATGVDYFLRLPSLRPDVMLTGARGIHGPAMRESVLFLMQAVSRNAAALSRRQAARTWLREPWPLLCGKTAVVLGTGVSGTAIAELLRCVGMATIGVTRTPRAIAAFSEVVSFDRLKESVARADYVVNVLPGDAKNVGLIDHAVLDAMKPSAFFINVGRGDSVDEAALVEAVRDKRISGAGLDVFRAEPLPPESPLWALDNVVLSPHVSGLFVEYPEHVLPIVADNLQAFIDGHPERMRNLAVRPAA
jgi:phosphoglycerate dehydrogenase-like enzyme